MRRFSQRNALVTLSDINITPLLDLAFVLLIIFVIITPSIRSRPDQGIDVNLPEGGAPTQKVDPRNLMVVSVTPDGRYALGPEWMPFDQIRNILIGASRANPQLVVQIRGDGAASYRWVFDVLNVCQTEGISCSLSGAPQP